MKTDSISNDYKLSPAEAKELMGVSVVPGEIRRIILKKYATEHGTDALIGLFAEFVGMANSVAINTREFIELFLITDCEMWPHQAEKINLPTIQGALSGAVVAREVDGMCGGCAYRIGTTANQSPITSLDAADCAEDGSRFLCHETMPPYTENEDGKKTCAGYRAARKEIIKNWATDGNG